MPPQAQALPFATHIVRGRLRRAEAVDVPFPHFGRQCQHVLPKPAFQMSEHGVEEAGRRALYKTWRTAARPPQIERLPRCLPLSHASGATPTSLAIARRSSVPQFGHLREHGRARCVAHARNALQQLVLDAPCLALAQPRGQIGVDLLDALVEPSDVLLQALALHAARFPPRAPLPSSSTAQSFMLKKTLDETYKGRERTAAAFRPGGRSPTGTPVRRARAGRGSGCLSTPLAPRRAPPCGRRGRWAPPPRRRRCGGRSPR